MKKVTLTELVAHKIIFALMLTSYFWMWARTDWQPYYTTIQNGIGIVLLVYFMMVAYRAKRYKQESYDEMAMQHLSRCDAICLRLSVLFLIGLAWVCAITGHIGLSATMMTTIGWGIMGFLIFLSVLRTLLFIYFERGGSAC